MENIADAMRADMERIDACKKVLKSLHDEIVQRIKNKADQEVILSKLSAVEGILGIFSKFAEHIYIIPSIYTTAAVVLQTKDATFTPDVKIVCPRS